MGERGSRFAWCYSAQALEALTPQALEDGHWDDLSTLLRAPVLPGSSSWALPEDDGARRNARCESSPSSSSDASAGSGWVSGRASGRASGLGVSTEQLVDWVLRPVPPTASLASRRLRAAASDALLNRSDTDADTSIHTVYKTDVADRR